VAELPLSPTGEDCMLLPAEVVSSVFKELPELPRLFTQSFPDFFSGDFV